MTFKNKTLLTTTSFAILSVLTMATPLPVRAADPMDQRKSLSSHAGPSVQSAIIGSSSLRLGEDHPPMGRIQEDL